MLTNIQKFFILFGSVIAILVRQNIAPSFVNPYMAIVNTISFILSYNIILAEIYTNLKTEYNKLNGTLAKDRIAKYIMLLYIGIFVLNMIIWIIIFKKYLSPICDLALLNDILGILSLCLALTGDFLSVFVHKILFYLFTR